MSPQAAARRRMAPDGRVVVVDIADMKVTQDPEEVLVTYGLGSCIAVCLWDPTTKTAGMIHYKLPMARKNPEKAAENPYMFGDSGIPLLFKAMYDLGCNRGHIIIKLVGGSSILDAAGVFNIGHRNHTIARKLLWRNGFVVTGEDVGGTEARTVRLRPEDGACMVITSNGERPL